MNWAFKIGDTITHQNGSMYTVLCHCWIERDVIPAIAYQSLTDGRIWIRPNDQFLQSLNGRPRFTLAARL